MPSAPAIEHFERRLIEMGCPERRLQEKVRELADHYEDLKLAALEEGLTESEAQTRAAALLGDPVMLAENIVRGLRQSSWWGRHPIIGFCLFPPLIFSFIWAGCFFALFYTCQLLGWVFGPAYDIDDATANILSQPDVFRHYDMPLNMGLNAVSVIILTVIFCWLARRSAVGLKWVIMTCAACLLPALFFPSAVRLHSITVYVWWYSPYWPNVAIPLAAALLAFLRQRKMENRVAPIPCEMKRARPDGGANIKFLRKLFLTPTHWLATALAAFIAFFAIAYKLGSNLEETRNADLEKRVWPVERAATLALLKTRQQAIAANRETTINLKPWVNAPLSASTDGAANAKGNNLADLPEGIHTFAGVPFDVEGRAQLLGRSLINSRKKFPEKIRNITIERKCDRLHLLHGASNVHSLNKQVARLVLHYRDGSQAEIGIVSGKHLLDWWGPIYNTDAGSGRKTTSPDTELAWAGSNPWIKKRDPDYSLRLYKSTFANPRPDLEIASIDYISTLADAAPFLVGLTVEQSIN